MWGQKSKKTPHRQKANKHKNKGESMKNILVGVSYLGTNYSGWQRQDNSLGIQEVIENAFEEIGEKGVTIYASGRTDAGVHAYEQCFSCMVMFSDIKKLPMALNSKLPSDIRILWAKEVEEDFHARFSAHKKTYQYRLKTAKVESPFDEFITAYIPYTLDLHKMQKAGEYILGTHDFSAFCSSKTTVPDFERTIYNFNITKDGDLYIFEITGNGFLYNMVRIIVGTMVDVGRGKILPSDVKKIIDQKDRANAGKTMPAKGLALKKVEY